MNARLSTMAVAALLACSLACSLGCQRKLTDQNLSCVKEDMSPKEVESILGQPNQIEARSIESEDPKELPIVRYIYTQNGKTVTLHFVDGKLRGQDGAFNK